MKILITESKVEKLAVQWLLNNYGDLVKIDDPDNYIISFGRDNNEIFTIFIMYDKIKIEKHIFIFLKNMLGLTVEQMLHVVKMWASHYISRDRYDVGDIDQVGKL